MPFLNFLQALSVFWRAFFHNKYMLALNRSKLDFSNIAKSNTKGCELYFPGCCSRLKISADDVFFA